MLSSLLALPPFSGLVSLPWWGYLLLLGVLTHLTIAAVTIFLHRHQAHRALDLHPAVSHFFRFWLWLTTGMVTREWVAIHRKHHARCEQAGDPHSPRVYGLRRVLLQGSELYREEAGNAATLEQFGHGTPDDAIERRLYMRHTRSGVGLLLVTEVLLFGPIGLTLWAVQMLWIPVFAAGVVNGLGHALGYRNFETADASTNILPWGVLIGGEELHNNHHAFASSAKLSARWYEFDLGWAYIRCLALVRLARVRRLAPKLRFDFAKAQADLDTVQSLLTHRYTVARRYARSLHEAYRQEVNRLREHVAAGTLALDARSLRKLKLWLQEDERGLDEIERRNLHAALAASSVLETLYAMRSDLAALWERSSDSREQLLQRLQDWCRRADASGIQPLQRFAAQLRAYA
jgi:stearoyl-CoA desaturase (delta-9 desaturase)